VHHDGEVTLAVKLEISQVGPLFQNLPTFNSRIVVQNTIRLRDGRDATSSPASSATSRSTA